MAQKSIIVVSPPGGVGEVTAVKAATMGNVVRWFVVTSKESKGTTQSVGLSQEALVEMRRNGGTVELAGAEVENLLLPPDDAQSAIGAVSQWCGTADCIVCTLDGVEAAERDDDDDEDEDLDGNYYEDENKDPVGDWASAVKVAVEQACRSAVGGTGTMMKLAILPTNQDDDDDDQKRSKKKAGGNLISSLFGKATAEVPPSLLAAMGKTRIAKLRHGDLFGTPESSSQFSALEDFPSKIPTLCEEYRMRSVRMDPTLAVSGTTMLAGNTRSSRHSVGEAAALMATGVLGRPDLDVCLTSLQGTDPMNMDLWTEEFQRIQSMFERGQEARMFTTSFSDVPDTGRLAEWLATKWAPAMLRSADISWIRSGDRPVYATRTSDDDVEIVWQEMVDFEPVVSGRMIIQVSPTGIVASRGPGDASKGYGKISSRPLSGEDVLVRGLAEAASQAVQKGLAVKAIAPKPAKKAVATTSRIPVVTVTTTETTTTTPPRPSPPKPKTTDTGPRQAGVRRSARRVRGQRKGRGASGDGASAPNKSSDSNNEGST